MWEKEELRDFLEEKVIEFNRSSFIEGDPVSIPHRFRKKPDIEIAGFFTAIFSWGNRRAIIQKSNELMGMMDDQPHDFILNHQPADLKPLRSFKHRTFNSTDLLYFIRFLNSHYKRSNTLEDAFLPAKIQLKKNSLGKEAMLPAVHTPSQPLDLSGGNEPVKKALSFFCDRFFSIPGAPPRTKKHIASPDKKSTCKRLNMFLRWMVRQDNKGVDFGIWKGITPAELICPVDLHVARVARGFELINRKQTDWQTAMELTLSLRDMDRDDPVKFDFALFGLGVTKKF